MLRRKIEQTLYNYYQNPNNKILVINGARQIGKSYIIRETASQIFQNYIEINLKDDHDSQQLFSYVRNKEDFYLQVSALFGEKLGTIENTIIFLDEIQVYPHMLSMLKQLKLDNRYRYIASGSLLGITLRHTFIPMGSIDEINMYPLDFEEFLWANGVGEDVIGYLKNCFINRIQVNEGIHNTILRRFREYLISGGLPEAVNEFVINKNVETTRSIQTLIHNYYKDDATQYDEDNNLRVRRIYDSLPSYMMNKVKRIRLNSISNKGKAESKQYEDDFDYLLNSGCTIGVKAVADPKFPLIESSAKNLLKLYFNDVGILSNVLYRNNILPLLNFDEGVNLGSIYETACAMELLAHGHELYYFDAKKTGEVDFLINDYDNLTILPIEIKSGNDQYNFRAIPKLVKEPYNLKKGYIFGNKNIIEEKDNLITFPIYMIMFI